MLFQVVDERAPLLILKVLFGIHQPFEQRNDKYDVLTEWEPYT